MTVRFRIRTSAGQELSFASHEMFEDFVRSGDLSLDDLVYDAEDGSWAPARTHPIVLEIEYEKEEAAEKAEKASEPSAENAFGLDLADAPPTADDETGADAPQKDGAAEGEGSGTDAQEPSDASVEGDSDAFGLALAPEDSLMTPDEEAQSFVARMEAERESEKDFAAPDQGDLLGFSMEDSGAFGGASEPVAAPPPPPPPPRPSRPRRGSSGGESTRRKPETSPPQRPKEKGGGGKKVAIGVLAIAALSAGGYFGLLAMRSAPDDVPTDSVEIDDPVIDDTPPPTPPPGPEPVIASTEAAVRERAQERFLTATQNLFRDLRTIPEVWPSGAYLSLPSDYAVVLDVWQEYLTTIRLVRAGDGQRFSAAYEAALDDAAVQGDDRQARLSVAISDLAEQAALRRDHYNRVEALATAALQSHAALLEAEGLVLFDATGVTGAQSEIGRSAYGRDADSQLLLDQVIELLSATLSADGLGPADGANVRAWVWDGFLDAVAN